MKLYSMSHKFCVYLFIVKLFCRLYFRLMKVFSDNCKCAGVVCGGDKIGQTICQFRWSPIEWIMIIVDHQTNKQKNAAIGLFRLRPAATD